MQLGNKSYGRHTSRYMGYIPYLYTAHFGHSFSQKTSAWTFFLLPILIKKNAYSYIPGIQQQYCFTGCSGSTESGIVFFGSSRWFIIVPSVSYVRYTARIWSRSMYVWCRRVIPAPVVFYVGVLVFSVCCIALYLVPGPNVSGLVSYFNSPHALYGRGYVRSGGHRGENHLPPLPTLSSRLNCQLSRPLPQPPDTIIFSTTTTAAVSHGLTSVRNLLYEA